jgi:hypothetical protein
MWFRKNPVEFEAKQWTGDNLEEIRQFVGYRYTADQHAIFTFTPIGTFLPTYLHVSATGELWVEANKTILPVETGEWIVHDELGFYPCKDEVLKKNNTPIDEPKEQ